MENAQEDLPEEDPKSRRLHPITQESLYVLALFVNRLLEVRIEPRDWNRDGDPHVEFQRWMRMDELEEMIGQRAKLLWEMGGGDDSDESRMMYFKESLEQDRNETLPWHDRFQSFQNVAETLTSLIAVQKDSFASTLGRRIVRVRGFSGQSAHECFGYQIVDILHRLNQLRGAGIPSGTDLLAMMQEWELELTAESGLLVHPHSGSDRDGDAEPTGTQQARGQADRALVGCGTISQATPIHDDARFARAGSKSWIVRLAGHETIMRDSKGLGFLHQLISRPNVRIQAWTLYHGTEPPPESIDEVVDGDTLEAVRGQLDILLARRAELLNPEEREDVDNEIGRLRKFITASTTGVGKRRRPRRVRTENEKVRERVGKAIAAALAAIKDCHPALYKHLDKTLEDRAGMEPCYACALGDLPAWAL